MARPVTGILRTEEPFVEFTKAEIEQSIPHRFEQQVRSNPSRLAVCDGNRQVSYRELNELANAVAWNIIEQRGVQPEPVAILLEQGVWPLAAILGILKAGKFYVPLEPSDPLARLTYMMEDADAPLIVTDQRNRGLAATLAPEDCLFSVVEELPTATAGDPDISVSPDALANIVYTSGSTGLPKGVYTNHRNVLWLIHQYTNAIRITRADRLSLLRSINFNGAVKDVFGSLLNGASLFPFDLHSKGFAPMAQWLSTSQITVYCSVATVFRQFLDHLPPTAHFSHVRVILIGAEPVYQHDVKQARRFFSPGCVVRHSFGTSESGTACILTVKPGCEVGPGPLPSGFPLENVHVHIWDEDGREAGPNQAGEIVVGSPYMALGYWRKPDLTAAKFIPDPGDSTRRLYRTGDLGRLRPDGYLIHLGRKDDQVKIGSRRVEIGEIEAAFLDLDEINEAAVVARPDRRDRPRLVAYVTSHDPTNLSLADLKRRLRFRLPAYMIPSAIVMLPALPKTPVGKTDRHQLPAPDPSRPMLDTPYKAARTPIEDELVDIWSSVLDIDQIGIHDAFLELGGNSLLAIEIVQLAIRAFHVEIPLQVLFEAPTVADMALAIVQNKAQDSYTESLEGLLNQLENSHRE